MERSETTGGTGENILATLDRIQVMGEYAIVGAAGGAGIVGGLTGRALPAALGAVGGALVSLKCGSTIERRSAERKAERASHETI